jgi:hypothetical protein
MFVNLLLIFTLQKKKNPTDSNFKKSGVKLETNFS